MSNFKNVEDCDCEGKRVLLRCDHNVPLDKWGNVVNDKRIRATLPTIEYLLKKRARIIIATHVGRPKGRVIDALRTDGVAARLELLLHMPVKKVDMCVGPRVKRSVAELRDGEVLVLENVRFFNEELDNDEEFAKELGSNADIFINDAFAVCHRSQASVTGVTNHLPSYAGYLVKKEMEMMGKALENPEKPFIVVIGGSKKDKIHVIENVLEKADYVMIGGKLANTFLKVKGVNIASSKYDEDSIPLAKELLKNASEKLILPIDVVVADKFETGAATKIVPVDEIPFGWVIVDIGPKTLELYKQKMDLAKTIIWGGPIGVFEIDKFAKGTMGLAKYLSEHPGTTIIGGGDSAAAVEKFKLSDKMTIVSTGGGASLTVLQGKELKGVKALEKNAAKYGN
jgi:phosphoglycerate kinase